ncbi:MAG TPA: IS200/IS605 family transposase [Pyrinomonadaceae bacterium]|nr:IS200/IS605 family transposase [Pyrinomonadaceae bacterium]
MSDLIRKKHNVSLLLYHIVCPAKYRKAVFRPLVDEKLKEICEAIALRYEIEFLEIGTDKDHVHFLVQSVPKYSPKKIVQTIKSVTAREIFKQMPEVKEQLWGGEFWSDGYFVSTVGTRNNEEAVKRYIKEQGRKNETAQLDLF